jgi:hypothetical protein
MKKNLILVAGVLVFASIYVVFFTGWFKPKIIQISYSSRSGAAGRGAATPLMFNLGEHYELTDVKVISVAESQTNANPRPLWHLVSDGSDSVSHFSYGEPIEGMDPAVAGTTSEPLQPGITYRILVTAGRAKGQHDFQAGAVAAK